MVGMVNFRAANPDIFESRAPRLRHPRIDETMKFARLSSLP